MAEKKGVGHAYNVDFLNVVFAASSLFLFLSVVWMVWDDYDREWKNTQRQFANLESQQKAAEQNVAANRAKVDELEKKLKDADTRLYRATLDYQYAKAKYDEDRYAFEASRAAGASNVAKKGQAVEEEARRLNDLNMAREKAEADKAEIQKQLGQYTGQVATVSKQIEEMHAEQTRLRKRLDVVAPSALKDYFRNAPLVDFMAPTIKIQQIILPNVVDDVNFIGGNSPHPIDKAGCTSCHEGMGQSVSFRDAAHAPSNEKQKEEWEKKYHWEEPHLWDYPMLPLKMTEASCAKCHRQNIYIPSAEKLNIAYATYERAGCYACHKTKGFDTNIRKPGPILTKIDSKLTPDWVKNWMRNPRAVKPTTWMPRFWYNSNNSSPDDAVRNEVEINSIAAYLFANAEKHEFAVKNPPHGDAKNGEQIVKSIGCLGCHVVGEGKRSEIGPRRTFGQPLENIGNKTRYEWIYNWVRDPKHYSPSTYMPNLRLTDPQVADVATYLVSLKGPAGDAAKATPDQKASDDVLLDYLKAVLPFEDAKAELAKMDAQQRQVELGRRAINRY